MQLDKLLEELIKSQEEKSRLTVELKSESDERLRAVAMAESYQKDMEVLKSSEKKLQQALVSASAAAQAAHTADKSSLIRQPLEKVMHVLKLNMETFHP